MTAIPLRTLIRPAVDHIAATYGAMGGPAAEAMMGAIGLQESKFRARDQLEMNADGELVPGRLGPATGYWQFERGGGVAGVIRHPASRRAAQDLVAAAGLPLDADAVWRHFATPEGDELAAAFARLLLLTDPQPLPMPEPQNERIAWLYYLRNWRPGKPHERFWAANWAEACAAVRAAPHAGGVVSAGPAPSVLLPSAPRPIVTAPGVPAVIAGHFAKVERELAELKRAVAAAAL
jgi:hypothetical protein